MGTRGILARRAAAAAVSVILPGVLVVTSAPLAQAFVNPKPLIKNYRAEGPVSAADVDLLVKVAQANMWEGSVSDQVAQSTKNGAVQLIAERLHKDHLALESVVQDLADEYGVVLPNQATRQQQAWVAQILAGDGDARDRTYVNIVRAAHGSIFSAIADVRASTQNDDLRAFAQAANEIVMRHMTLLEGSGLAQTTSLVVDPVSTRVINQAPLTASQVLWSTLGAILACMCTIVLVRRFGRWGQPEVS